MLQEKSLNTKPSLNQDLFLTPLKFRKGWQALLYLAARSSGTHGSKVTIVVRFSGGFQSPSPETVYFTLPPSYWQELSPWLNLLGREVGKYGLSIYLGQDYNMLNSYCYGHNC